MTNEPWNGVGSIICRPLAPPLVALQGMPPAAQTSLEQRAGESSRGIDISTELKTSRVYGEKESVFKSAFYSGDAYKKTQS